MNSCPKVSLAVIAVCLSLAILVLPSLTERLTEHAASPDAARIVQALVTSLSEAPDLTSDPDARAWLDGELDPAEGDRVARVDPSSLGSCHTKFALITCGRLPVSLSGLSSAGWCGSSEMLPAAL